ncbi:hypothetical protein [Nitrososphaera sp.]|uniref:hypothetical protein n=1 Tax=Nitrososphaera sp. TaxID=1971748 RepID=UPI002EDA85B9
MALSSLFPRPLLIYDDECGPCTRFARAASGFSRGWIRTAGHGSQEARNAKTAVFPEGYDATKMFWLINKHGAFGARSGLAPLTQGIMAGWLRGGKNDDTFSALRNPVCSTPDNALKRLAKMLSHGATFRF